MVSETTNDLPKMTTHRTDDLFGANGPAVQIGAPGGAGNLGVAVSTAVTDDAEVQRAVSELVTTLFA